MANTYSITLTDAEDKAMSMIAVDVNEWVQNAVKARAAAAIDEVYARETQLMMANSAVTSIPTDKHGVVLASTQPTAAKRHADMLANMPKPVA